MASSAHSWLEELREVLHEPGAPLKLRNGLWHVENREELWKSLGTRILDIELDTIRECAVLVLREKDPQFELEPEQRFAAAVYGKELRHSHGLRQGLSETLALLGNRSASLVNCSLQKAEITAALAVREILEDADWVLWASLGGLLPVLAEAAPEEFLTAVESELEKTPNSFDELFAQEGTGITGASYVSGLLWALETLAWEESLLVRVCVNLGKLAERDPGGSWANRPINSLITILLPWIPQTIASAEKRMAAVRTLQREIPDVAWKLLLNLLPNQTLSSTPTRKPVWLDSVPEDWHEGVTQGEYWDQESSYADLAVEMAIGNPGRLEDLIDLLHNLTGSAFERVLEHLSSDEIASKPEEQLMGIWNALSRFAQTHREFSNAEWAIPSESVSKIEAVAAKLSPQNPVYRHRAIFQWSDLDYESEDEDLRERKEARERDRVEAVEEILSYGGMNAIVSLVQSGGSSFEVADSLSTVAGKETDDFIIPAMFDSKGQGIEDFVRYYVSRRRNRSGWEWVDGLDRSNWSKSEIAQLLSYLPFEQETWDRVVDLLGKNEGEYWVSATLRPIPSEKNIDCGIDKLIAHRRIGLTLQLLGALGQIGTFDAERSAKALLAVVSQSGSVDPLDPYRITSTIKALQTADNVSADDLVKIEWAFLPLLDGHRGVLPQTLERRLSSNPDTFCQVIRLVYRSRKENGSETEASETERANAENAWSLLRRWRVPPGVQTDGSFSTDLFETWLKTVGENCEASGHVEVAYTHIGQILIHCPADPTGLWIHQSAAEALNSEDAEEMRKGFHIGIVNSRGVRRIDGTGQPELELARQYNEKADAVENAGYYRFAEELRRLADSYSREADWIVDRHATDG